MSNLPDARDCCSQGAGPGRRSPDHAFSNGARGSRLARALGRYVEALASQGSRLRRASCCSPHLERFISS